MDDPQTSIETKFHLDRLDDEASLAAWCDAQLKLPPLNVPPRRPSDIHEDSPEAQHEREIISIISSRLDALQKIYSTDSSAEGWKTLALCLALKHEPTFQSHVRYGSAADKPRVASMTDHMVDRYEELRWKDIAFRQIPKDDRRDVDSRSDQEIARQVVEEFDSKAKDRLPPSNHGNARPRALKTKSQSLLSAVYRREGEANIRPVTRPPVSGNPEWSDEALDRRRALALLRDAANLLAGGPDLNADAEVNERSNLAGRLRLTKVESNN